jgi:integrase
MGTTEKRARLKNGEVLRDHGKPVFRWRAVVRMQGRKMSQTFDLKANAEDWIAEQERLIRRGQNPDATAMSLADAIHRYEIEVSKRKRGYEQEKYRLEAWRRDALADKRLNEIRAWEIAAYIRDRQTGKPRPPSKKGSGNRGVRERAPEPVGAQTILSEVTLLQAIFETAIKDWGLDLHNPVRSVRKPRRPRPRNRRLEAGELERLLAACRGDDELRTFILLSVQNAMRRGEQLRLRWEDIDLDRGIAHLRETKTGEPRSVALTPEVVALLGSIKEKSGGPAEGSLWSQRDPRSWSRAVARAIRRAGLEDLRLHDLRHEATSRLFERGLTIEEVAAITGHKTWTMLRRYTHLRPENIAAKLRRAAPAPTSSIAGVSIPDHDCFSTYCGTELTSVAVPLPLSVSHS